MQYSGTTDLHSIDECLEVLQAFKSGKRIGMVSPQTREIVPITEHRFNFAAFRYVILGDAPSELWAHLTYTRELFLYATRDKAEVAAKRAAKGVFVQTFIRYVASS